MPANLTYPSDQLEKEEGGETHLVLLSLISKLGVKDCLVHFIVKKCPELECLILSSCSQITDISLMEISTHLPSVRYA
ncbi:hypothetical protein JD844_009122 [Phrynosoma platyrhinos]|uniref:F-box and leucine-rich repeat protein 2 n=1 Tax=Phrynosoma platyrhinos TaxID=52577 RepID=A0ABQ7TF03_PHRPL|nr:hypothetical protein JD844_009122 [Phrynosoma platyrhinos]